MSHSMRPLGRARYLASGISLLALIPYSLSAQDASDEAVMLDPITLYSDSLSTESEVSAEDLQTRYSGNAQNALNTIPGVSTRQTAIQPGIEVNIRGMSGYGRVNAMIDGVPQSFKNTAGHGASGGSLLYIHPEFLQTIEVERGVVSGAAGAGTLTGAANFHTLTLDDVLLEGQSQGGMARLRFGDNGYNYSGMLSFGSRFDGLWGGNGHVDVLFGYAASDEDDYATGDGGELGRGRSSVNAPTGTLAKIEIVPNSAHKLSFGRRGYENTFANSRYTWDVDNVTWTADYEFTPGNDFVNLGISAYYNDTSLFYPGSRGSYAGRSTEEETRGLSITNRSLIALGGGGNLVLDYGLSWTQDDFQTHAKRGGNHPGKLDKASLFVDGELTYGRTTFFGGLRYDYWHANGYRPPYPAGTADCPAGGPSCGDEWVSRDGGELLPHIGISYDLTPEFTIGARYAHTFRPPTTHEMFYAMVPFGNGKGTGMTNNLNLKPEYSRSFELSGEYHRSGLLSAQDEAWFRVSAFHNRIENYIYNDFVTIPGVSYKRAMWVNSDATAVMQGVEFEGGYDNGRFYANLSFSISDTEEQAMGQGTAFGNGLTSAQPDTTATLDIGTRLFDERLTLGGQIRYTGSNKQVAFDWSTGAYLAETDSYTLVDLYGNYEISDRAELFVSVENVFDTAYGYPGGSAREYKQMEGRGRTVTAGVTTRF